MNDDGLRGRVFLVTGSGRGLGAALARAAGVEKARVVVNCRRDSKAAEAVAADVQKAGGEAITVLAEGIGDGDGAVRLDDGRYLVSEWPGRMFEVAPDGALAVTLDTKAAGRFMNDFIRVGDQLIVPNWMPGSLTAYRIIP